MRKAAVLATLLAVAFTVAPSHGGNVKTGRLVFQASPCHLLCTYHTEDVNAVSPAPVDPCKAPAPAGSYDDIVLKAPLKSRWLSVSVTPEGDWDLFVCSKPSRGNNGTKLGESMNSPFECQVGCTESILIRVSAGKSYVVRAYNFADTVDLPGRYAFRT